MANKKVVLVIDDGIADKLAQALGSLSLAGSGYAEQFQGVIKALGSYQRLVVGVHQYSSNQSHVHTFLVPDDVSFGDKQYQHWLGDDFSPEMSGCAYVEQRIGGLAMTKGRVNLLEWNCDELLEALVAEASQVIERSPVIRGQLIAAYMAWLEDTLANFPEYLRDLPKYADDYARAPEPIEWTCEDG